MNNSLYYAADKLSGRGGAHHRVLHAFKLLSADAKKQEIRDARILQQKNQAKSEVSDKLAIFDMKFPRE